MNVEGEISISAPRPKVFEALQNADFFAACIEGLRELRQVDDRSYAAVFETNIAYMRFRFDMGVEFVHVRFPDLIEAKMSGTPHGLIGRLTANSRISLKEAGSGTSLHYMIESSLTGRLGSIGQPVLRAKAKDLETKFASRINAAFADGVPKLAV